MLCLLISSLLAQSQLTRAQGKQSLTLLARVDAAIELSVDCLNSFAVVYSDQLWFLLQAQQRVNSSRLDKVLDQLRARATNDGMLALVAMQVSKKAPPPTGPTPWQELVTLMRHSVACRNGDEPSSELQTFVSEKHEGYVLTHQILAVEWARYVGCSVPDEWYARESELIDYVRAELESDESFSDLFVERVAVVALAGKPSSLKGEWLERMLAAQSTDGCWRSRERVRIQFRGHSLLSTTDYIPLEHTTSLIVSTLAHYRNTLEQ